METDNGFIDWEDGWIYYIPVMVYPKEWIDGGGGTGSYGGTAI